jgi:hypothetical protein
MIETVHWAIRYDTKTVYVMCNILLYTYVNLLGLISDMCHINAKNLAKRMANRLLQLRLKIAYVYTYSNTEGYIAVKKHSELIS